MIEEYGLAMDLGDIRFCQEYFRREGRCPTMTELRLIDTYWSDHCRHTTFGTILTGAEIAPAYVQKSYETYLELRERLYAGRKDKPVTLMDLATIGAKALKAAGKLPDLDESEEINACSVRIPVDVDGQERDWVLMFKNETHNHPTEIEPFGGAATCLGGAIRDPLSGRSYVYQAMRVTGAADPRKPVEETLPGKLPQRKIVTTAAAGYSSYGNQIGLATGHVHEIYHPGYVAKRMEIGAVLGAAPRENIVRERPMPGDKIILLGGRTGPRWMRRRDGVFQVAHAAFVGKLRRRGTKGQCAGGTQVTAAVPQPGGDAACQALQRLRGGRRGCGNRRAGRRIVHRPRPGAKKI